MTQSMPRKHSNPPENTLLDKKQNEKSFLDLSPAEIEHIAIEATKQSVKRMHDKGISTIIAVEEQVYEVHPDGTRTLRHG